MITVKTTEFEKNKKVATTTSKFASIEQARYYVKDINEQCVGWLKAEIVEEK